MTGSATFLLCALAAATAGCGHDPALRGRVAALTQLADAAQANGAMSCAPRQLAVARAELHFAALELDQGFSSKASAHLAVAELNARAASNLSPVGGCDAPVGAATVGPEDGDGDRTLYGPQDDSERSALPDDGGGVPDAEERCPAEPEGHEPQEGCPSREEDGGAVPVAPDRPEECPNTPDEGDWSSAGCPAEPRAPDPVGPAD